MAMSPMVLAAFRGYGQRGEGQEHEPELSLRGDMLKTVIFHIGLPKTGTTTIQTYLRNQDERLRSLGYLYPGAREHPGFRPDKHLLILSAMLGNEPPKSTGMNTQDCREAVAQVFEDFRISDLNTLIWSHEGISSRVFGLDAKYMKSLLRQLNIRIFLSVRYLDDWIESLYKERIRAQGGNGRGRRASMSKPKPLLPLASLSEALAEKRQPAKSMLEECSEIPASLRLLREILPAAEIVVQSYDANLQQGKVVSGALAAMGLPVASAFADADEAAGVRNPTKSNLYSMLIYNLVMGRAGAEVVRAVTVATKRRSRAKLHFEPLVNRRFRFLSEESILDARGYYEELRQDYPHLPVQPPYAPDPAERSLPRDEGVALLDWLRPDISDAVFSEACAAYKSR
jgi:hypothetical protein